MFTQTSKDVARRLATLALIPLLACVLAAPAQQTQVPGQQQVKPTVVPAITQSFTWNLTSNPATRSPATASVTIGWVATSPPELLVADLHCYDGETVVPDFKFVEFVPGSVGGFFEWTNLDPSSIYTANLTATFPNGDVAEANTLYF